MIDIPNPNDFCSRQPKNSENRNFFDGGTMRIFNDDFQIMMCTHA